VGTRLTHKGVQLTHKVIQDLDRHHKEEHIQDQVLPRELAQTTPSQEFLVVRRVIQGLIILNQSQHHLTTSLIELAQLITEVLVKVLLQEHTNRHLLPNQEVTQRVLHPAAQVAVVTKVVEEAEVVDHPTQVDLQEVQVDRVPADQEVQVVDPDLLLVADKYLCCYISNNL
jgi:hypothetical protein